MPHPGAKNPQLLQVRLCDELVGGQVHVRGWDQEQDKDAKAEDAHVLADGWHRMAHLMVHRAQQ